ncbi:MAG: hypothetical protein ABIS06_14700 [Vicinamibacterales bacterium]
MPPARTDGAADRALTVEDGLARAFEIGEHPFAQFEQRASRRRDADGPAQSQKQRFVEVPPTARGGAAVRRW